MTELQRHKEMARLIKKYGTPSFGRKIRVDERFSHLAMAIASQQLHGKAAQTIWERMQVAADGPFTAANVLRQPIETWRQCGLSGTKVSALLDLADAVESNRLDLGALGRKSEDEVISELVQVRGIGPWTAQMFLMFALHRRDVWPAGDYGVRVGYSLAFGYSDIVSAKELEGMADAYRPWRSLVAWYCWRVADDR